MSLNEETFTSKYNDLVTQKLGFLRPDLRTDELRKLLIIRHLSCSLSHSIALIRDHKHCLKFDVEYGSLLRKEIELERGKQEKLIGEIKEWGNSLEQIEALLRKMARIFSTVKSITTFDALIETTGEFLYYYKEDLSSPMQWHDGLLLAYVDNYVLFRMLI